MLHFWLGEGEEMNKIFVTVMLVLLIILGVGIKLIYGYETQKTNLNKTIDNLKNEKQSLAKSIEEEQKMSKENKQKITDLIIVASKAKSEAINALNELNKIKKPVIISPIKDDMEITKQIKTYYNDDTTTFLNDKFMICKNTTYMIVTDAVNWKTNYPIFQTNLSKNGEAISALKKEVESKDTLINQQSISISNFDKSLNLQALQISNNKAMIDDLNKSLNLEKKKSTVEKVCYFVGGAVVMFTAVRVVR
jgi:hypothetical protein